MNKTVSINLSGQVFQIDEPAYDRLKNYLDSIRRRFSASDGGNEIIADIEARIAELFREKLNDMKQVITLADVEGMMQHMGKPEEFETTADAEDVSSSQQKSFRRLFRNPDDKIIAGVCSGISAYLGIEDPLWFRLAFIIAVIFSFGSPILIYIILWIIVPEAKTSSERLQMKGENITISNIEKTIKDDLGDLKDRIENLDTKGGARKARNFLAGTVDFILGIIFFLLKLALKLTAAVLIFTGLVIIFALVVAVIFPAYLDGFTLSSLYPLFFATKTMVFLGIAGIVLLIGIPALAITLLGFHLLLNNRRRTKGLGVSLFGLWLVGLGLVAFTAAKTASDFRASDSVRTELPIVQPAGDTIFLESKNERLPGDVDEYDFFWHGVFTPIDSDYVASGRVRLDIKKSLSEEYQLTQEIESRGRNRSAAGRRAEAVVFQTTQTDSSLILSNLISFPISDHFRGQEVKLLLKVPEGKSVFISESAADILYDVENTNDTYDRDMVGHLWTMLHEGLTCMDCDAGSLSVHPSHFPKGKEDKEFDFNGFNEISAGGAFNVEIRHGDEFSVSASGTRQFINNLEISKESDRLDIYTRHGFHFFRQEGSGTVTITLPELSRLKIGGANKSVITGFKGNNLNLAVTGASEVEMRSSFDNLIMELTGASSMELSGSGSEMKVTANGASKLKAFGYKVSGCDIEASGASKAEVNASDDLKAEANGASEIQYKGLPKISSDVTGFSSIKPSK